MLLSREEMNVLAKDIKTLKSKFKITQREFEHNKCFTCYHEYNSTGGGFVKPPKGCTKLWNKIEHIRTILRKAQDTFRLNHVERCLKRGITYDKIEINPKWDDYNLDQYKLHNQIEHIVQNTDKN